MGYGINGITVGGGMITVVSPCSGAARGCSLLAADDRGGIADERSGPECGEERASDTFPM